MKRFYLLLYLLILPSYLFCQTSDIDSLKRLLKNAKHDSIKCSLLNKLIEVDEAMDARIGYYDQITALGEKNLNEPNINLRNYYLLSMSSCINNKAYYFTIKGNIIEALELYEKSLMYTNLLGDRKNAAYMMNNIGAIYDSQGDLVKALIWFQKSLKELNDIKDTLGMASTFCNIGNIHKKQKDPKTALSYYKKSLNFFEKINDQQGISTAYNYLGIIFQTLGDTSLSLNYFEKSLKIREEIKNKPGIAQSLNNIGSIYKKRGDLNRALEYYQRSITLYKELQDLKGIVNTSDNTAQVLYEQGKSNEALNLAKESMRGAMKLGSPLVTRNIASTLRSIYLGQNNYQEAYKMFELQMKMKDSLDNMETRKATYKHELQFHYEKKESELKAQQDKENAIAKEKLKQKENERNYFIAGFGMLIVFSGFVYRGYRQKKKDNKTITNQKTVVDQKQKEILDSIHYAKRIQQAHMPNEKMIAKTFERLKKQNESSF